MEDSTTQQSHRWTLRGHPEAGSSPKFREAHEQSHQQPPKTTSIWIGKVPGADLEPKETGFPFAPKSPEARYGERTQPAALFEDTRRQD